MRRRLVSALAVAAVLVSSAAPAAADDLSDMLDEATDAEYHGTGVVMCTWGGDSSAASYEVTRTDGMTMVEGPGGSAMAYGGVAATSSDGGWSGTEVSEWSDWLLSDRYTMGGATATTRLGRDATLVVVLDEGKPRLRMAIDDETGVPLLTEVLDADGGVYRMAVLVSFTPGPSDMPDDMDVEMTDTIAPMPATTTLPESVAGYRRADVYAAGRDSIHAFYSDGLFSFSVFESPRTGLPAAFERATVFEVSGKRYRRLVTPTSVWVHWDAPDRSYLLVGDLPPDHLMGVLQRLPAPGQRGFLVRLWRALFG